VKKKKKYLGGMRKHDLLWVGVWSKTVHITGGEKNRGGARFGGGHGKNDLKGGRGLKDMASFIGETGPMWGILGMGDRHMNCR